MRIKTSIPPKRKSTATPWSSSSPQVSKPVAVRFGWKNYPEVNLFNKSGLPAVPFRTDDFPSPPHPGSNTRVRWLGFCRKRDGEAVADRSLAVAAQCQVVGVAKAKSRRARLAGQGPGG